MLSGLKRNGKILLWMIAIFLLLFARVANSHLLNFFDYDAITNYTIIQELAQGDYSQLFHHASPLFYVIFLPLYILNANSLWLEYIFAGVNVFSVCFFVSALSDKLKASFGFKIAAFSVIGNGMTYFSSSRYFSIDSLSLLFLFSSFYFLYKYLYEKKEKILWIFTWLSLSAAICINYKHLYFLAFFVGLLVIKKTPISYWLTALLTTLSIPSLLIIIGKVNGISILTYPKYFGVQAFVKDMNPYAHVPPVRLDIDFYLRYLFSFEPAWILFLSVLLIYIWIDYRKFISIAKNNTVISYLLVITIPYLLLICLLQKAPRGLLPVYIPFSLCILFYSQQYLTKGWFIGCCLAILIAQYSLIYNEFYKHQHNGYKEMAQFIKDKQINKIIITSGKGLIPHLNSQLDYIIISHEDELDSLIQKGYEYLVVDYFYLVAHPFNYPQVDTKKSLFSSKEATLLNRMVFLEHSEYTGLSYQQTMQNFKKISNLNNQLYLLSLKNGKGIN